LKLANGYNIGIKLTKDSKLKLLARATKDKVVSLQQLPQEEAVAPIEAKPELSIISTGGTIASYVDYRTGAVHPALTAEELIFSVPELLDKCTINAKVLFSLLSEDLRPVHWQKLAEAVTAKLRRGVSGVIIPHGTDTMGYTGAALSFMIRNLPAPIIIVGSQRSSDRPSSDATTNLMAATKLALNSDLGEVVIVMHAGMSDTYAWVHRGTKVRKMHTSRRDAFQSINMDPLGNIDMVRETITLHGNYTKRAENLDALTLNTKLDDNVCLLQFYPGMAPDLFDYVAERYHGIVLVGTGLGHVASTLLDNVRTAIRDGVHIVMTSQCLYGRINMNVYSNGRDLLKVGVIPGEDMLPETAYVKLMWVLGQTTDPSEVRNLMLQNIVGEITARSSFNAFCSGG
jgi:glutamyl-tRNA(Gln) amidotransferase subunit D